MKIKKKPEYKEMRSDELGILIVFGLGLLIVIPISIRDGDYDGVLPMFIIFALKFFKFFKIEF